MEIERNAYLSKLIRKRENGLIKIITGIRRCGKSFLLFKLFNNYLQQDGIEQSHIIKVALDDRRNKSLRDPDKILNFIESSLKDSAMYYILLDEIQYLPEFEDVLISLMHIDNVDVYVTGSNSKLLSSDVVTQFRGRGDEIRVRPLSFSEFMTTYNGSTELGWDTYLNYGGLPYITQLESEIEKAEYLNSLFRNLYLTDIIERNNIKSTSELEELIDFLASSIGSNVSYKKLENTFKSKSNKSVTDKTIKNYINYMMDAFLISEAKRYDVKGKNYIGSPVKYYFEDVGLRNARLGFRQVEPTHLMENIIYNELLLRGYNVDVGIVETHKQNSSRQLEVDFVATLGNNKIYIQSAYSMTNPEKEAQEKRSLRNISDSFKKIILVGDSINTRRDEYGIITLGVREFLLDNDSLNI